MSKEYTRRFSLGEDFMSWHTDDILYGALSYLATFQKTDKKLYLTKQNLNKNRKDLYMLCDLNAQNLRNHIQTLISRGLLKEEKVNCNGEMLDAYIFTYDYNVSYQIIDWEMLWYIVSTRSKSSIKVYVYLLNKYLWKKEIGEKYTFTNDEVQQAIGYSKKSNLSDSAMTNILESLKREGIIDYCEFYEEIVSKTGKVIQKPTKRLIAVAEKKNDLPETKNQ